MSIDKSKQPSGQQLDRPEHLDPATIDFVKAAIRRHAAKQGEKVEQLTQDQDIDARQLLIGSAETQGAMNVLVELLDDIDPA